MSVVLSRKRKIGILLIGGAAVATIAIHEATKSAPSIPNGSGSGSGIKSYRAIWGDVSGGLFVKNVGYWIARMKEAGVDTVFLMINEQEDQANGIHNIWTWFTSAAWNTAATALRAAGIRPVCAIWPYPNPTWVQTLKAGLSQMTVLPDMWMLDAETFNWRKSRLVSGYSYADATHDILTTLKSKANVPVGVSTHSGFMEKDGATLCRAADLLEVQSYSGTQEHPWYEPGHMQRMMTERGKSLNKTVGLALPLYGQGKFPGYDISQSYNIAYNEAKSLTPYISWWSLKYLDGRSASATAFMKGTA